ncbi:anti-sigma factor domain-containing protein [Bacillus aquiflavi]|uniref:anti-sigma factor domain-containing protein n=1 Tax=Bacillus aquiflavi TaxID=2672567 RepID=UPI00223B8E66|nr:anti-sigma factor domain-containing protein [Bacillus aquiflavi]
MDERFLTLLTPDGEFLRARKLNQDYEIGQEIEFVPIRTKKRQKKSFFTLSSLQMKAALVASIALIAAILLPFYNGNKVYAYMTIDINPSIEIGVNKNMDVIKLAAYNDEGKSIINELTDWKRKDISTVMKLILNKSKERDYINDRDQVLIATVYEGKQKNKFEEKLDSCIKEIKIVLKKEDLLLKVIEGTTEDRIKAKEKGLSTGRYIERKQQKFMENKTKKSEHKKETKEEENKLEPSSDQVEKENKEIEEPNPTTAPPNSNGQGNNKENVPINHQHHQKKKSLSKSKRKPKYEPKRKPKCKPKRKPKRKSKPKPKCKPKSKSKRKPKRKPKRKSKPKPKCKPKSKSKWKPKCKSKF